MDKVVKGATKIKLAAPKSKYVETILSATNGGEAGVAEVFRTLTLRVRDSTWTIVFKALIIVHLMIREGQGDVTLRYIAESPKRIAISSFTEVQTQGANIKRYFEYLLERIRGYEKTKADFVKVGAGRLKRLTVDKGLLRETESVQQQIRALVRCDLLGTHDPENEITLTAFRLLTMDLLELFKVMNEGTINILEHYFEMSRPDAERALSIYKTFGRQTEQVVQYLSIARQYEVSTRLEVPRLKHAPTTLTSSLEEYLEDPDFEVNRRQYLAQQEAKRSGRPMPASQASSKPQEKTSRNDPFASASINKAPTVPTQAVKGPSLDLIDFFESIDANQQPMAQHGIAAQGYEQRLPQQQFQPQQSGYDPFSQQITQAQFSPQQYQQQTGQLYQQQQFPQQQQIQPVHTNFTGAGFGGYPGQQNGDQALQSYAVQSSLSSMSPTGTADFNRSPQPLAPQQTSTNPFRQSSLPIGFSAAATSLSPAPQNPNRQYTNPFARAPVQTQAAGPGAAGAPNDFLGSNTSTSPLQSQQQDFQFNSALYGGSTSSPLPQQQQQQLQGSSAPIQPQRTGTNPFAKNRSPAPVPAVTPISTNPTGGTNPFRQSAFVNQQTGQGWQRSDQGIFGNVDTIPVFPRPGGGQ